MNDIQTKHVMLAPPGFGWDEEGLVGVTFLHLDREAEHQQEIQHLREQVALELLRFLCADGLSPLQVGRNAFLVLDGLRKGDFDSDAQLASRIEVTPPRLAQLYKALERQCPMLHALIRENLARS